jgi:hypothetical protein
VEDARLPGWRLEVEEMSAGVYRFRATDADGRRIEATGADVDALIDDARHRVLLRASQEDSGAD